MFLDNTTANPSPSRLPRRLSLQFAKLEKIGGWISHTAGVWIEYAACLAETNDPPLIISGAEAREEGERKDI